MSSEYIIELQEGLRATLPFDDKRDFRRGEEGLHRRAALQTDHG